MSYASIISHIDVGHGAAGLVKLAADLASRFGARLIGVCSTLPTDVPISYRDLGDVALKSSAASQLVGLMSETELAFRRTSAAVSHLSWRSSFDLPTSALLREARAADLIVVGRNDPDDFSSAASSIDVDELILQAGRPVLLIPPAEDHLSGNRVLVACTDSKESRRAIRDSIPFLQRAEEVTLIEACQRGTENAALDRLADVENYLTCHGVGPCTKYYVHERGETGEELMRVGSEEGATLIVAGAYGHTRIGEWAFGGVTRDLLRKSPVPCLFSH